MWSKNCHYSLVNLIDLKIAAMFFKSTINVSAAYQSEGERKVEYVHLVECMTPKYVLLA